MAAVLVTLTDAKAHLKITTPDGHPGDADIQAKLDAAEGIIRKHLKLQDDPSWTPATVPPPIPAAILLQLADLDIHRGGPGDDNAPNNWDRIQTMLRPYRDPALA